MGLAWTWCAVIWTLWKVRSRASTESLSTCPPSQLVAEVLAGLATDTAVYSSRPEEALKVNKLTFTIRASDSSWHHGLPGV